MKRMILRFFIGLLLSFCVLTTSIWAQVKDVRFKNIGLKEGLSHDKAHCILQDSKGFMWLGTRNGLNLYDGYNFTVYRHDPKDSNSITSNRIQVLFEDSQENIWIGTYDGGLSVYNRYTHTFRSFQYNPEDPNSISSNNIYEIFEDSKQQIWIGTYGGGLCRFNRDQQNFEVFRNNPEDPKSLINNAVFDILEDKEGKLWLATFGGGLCMYDPTDRTFTAYQHIPEDPSSIPTNDLYSLCQDLSENIWIGTYGKGLIKFNVTTKYFTNYTHQTKNHTISSNYILSLTSDNLGNLWIATQDGGVNYMEVNTEKFHVFKKNKLDKHEIRTDNINSVYLDKADVLWIATDGEGIYITNAGSVIFDNFIGDGVAIPGFKAKSVTAIYEDTQNNLWLGSFGEGVYKFDNEQQEIINYTHNIFDENSMAGNFITAIVEDKDQTLWIGTLNEGLSRFNPQTGQWKTYQYQSGHPGSLSNNTINTLHVDKQGNLWVGTDGGGLCKFDEDTETFTTYIHDPYSPDRSLVGNAVKVIFEDENSLWLGTKSSGISRFELSTYEFTNFQHTDGSPSTLPSNEIIDIVKDKQGKLWIGTFDKGVCQLNIKDKTYHSLTSENGLISDNICSLLNSEDGSVWISTIRGLSRLNPSTLHIQNFTTDDGLHNQEFVQWSSFKNKNNELFLGHLGGFIRFNPNMLDKVEHQAPVYVTSFRLFDEKVTLETPNFAFNYIELKHNDNFFELEYALLSYKNSVENEYAYIMENLDQNWKFVSHRRIASYTNLDAGTYIFKVKAKDKNGSWREIAKPITIVIHPAWYNTWWFRIVAFLVTTSLCLIYYYNKIKAIKQRNEQLEHLVAERTHELVEKNEEINTQKENIEEQNDRLVEVQAIIQERNRELRIINEELEDRVEQRTKELRLANTQLQKANEELDTFVYRSYHDIIGPISRIQGLCYVAALDVKDASALEYINKLSDSSDKAKITLLRVLSIYHIRNHEVKIEETDVLELIYSITAHFEKQLLNLNLEIEYEKDFFALINTDQELLRTVLTNLIENAIRYSRLEKDSQIKISLKKLTMGTHPTEINIQIRDNGIGILKEVRNKVFTMFFRGNNERSGTGLGLYLTKIAVQKLGGTIHYQHTITDETVFDLKLPLIPTNLTGTVKVLQENKH